MTRRSGGFTMVELMIAMMIIGILTAIALPAMSSFVKNDRTRTQANILVLTMNYARSEAVKRDLPNGVSVCTTANQLTCSAAAWKSGWIVRVNDPANPVTLQAVTALAGPNTMTEAAGVTELRFMSNGTVVFVGNPGLAGASFKVCDQANDPRYARDVELSVTGRIVSSNKGGVTVGGANMVCP